jgi:hypothetical protein
VEGTIEEVTEKLKGLTLPHGQLITWVELRIKSEESPVLVSEKVRKLAEEVKETVRIVDFRQSRGADKAQDLPLNIITEALEDLHPTIVFNRLLDAHQIQEGRELLMEAFSELLCQQED